MSERSRNLSRRTVLACPGSSEKMHAKAPGLDVDMVFLDLEDAVAPGEKEAARPKVVQAVKDQDWGDKIVCVRVNAWDSPWTVFDMIEVVAGAGERLDTVMLPKVQSAAEVVAADMILTQIEQASGLVSGHLGLECQIETAEGLLRAEEICKASPRMEAIIFGPGDFAASMEMPVTSGGVEIPEYPGDHFHHVFNSILMAGRAAGIQVIDGPYFRIKDTEGLASYCHRTRILGYDGKWVLHPGQVDIVNAAFSPGQDQFDRAHRLLEAYEEATSGQGQGAAWFEDEMIDEASRKMALKAVARGERAGLERGPATEA